MNDLFDAPDELDLIVSELRKYPGWPVDDLKDRAYVRDLLDGYPDLNMVDEIRAWRIWMMDHEQKKEVKPRARFHTWLRNARTYAARPAARREGSQNPRRTQTTARPAEAFGASSQHLSRW